MVFGEFKVVGYINKFDNKEYVVFIKGDIDYNSFVFVCVYFECLIGDVFGFECCDCGF